MTLKEFVDRRSNLWKAFMSYLCGALTGGITGLATWESVMVSIFCVGTFFAICKIWDVK